MAPKPTLCDCCKKMKPKIHAVSGGVRYCYACYKREFKAVLCARCGKTTRSPGGKTPAFCKGCRHADQPCKRCGKVGLVGKVYQDGSIACPSCVRHFEPPKVCASCGVTSIHLSRDFKSGFNEPVCPKCRRLAGFFTCPGCRKHRRPAGTSSDGRTLCEGCLKHDGKFICPRCGEEGIRHSNKRCEECYWLDYAAETASTLAGEFTCSWTQEAFIGLVNELLSERNGRDVFIRLKKYQKFFMVLDGAFPTPDKVTPSALSELYGKGRFVSHHRIVGFLIHTKVLPANIREQVKEADVVLRQRQVIKKAEGKWFHPLLEEYYRHLWKKHDAIRNHGWVDEYSRFVPSTITTYLDAAFKFLSSLPKTVISYTAITQRHVDAFLRECPGATNPLRGFGKFIRYQKRVFQKFSIERPTQNFDMNLLIGQEKYLSLLKAWLNPENDEDLKESVICLLILMYAQRKKDIVKLKLMDIVEKDGRYGFCFGRVDLMLDGRLNALLKRYLEQRQVINRYDDVKGNPYLFPGSNFRGHLSALSVRYYFMKHGVTEPQLFATAMWKLYRNGVTAPKVVEDGTGVSDVTAFKYFALTNPRLVNETNKILKMLRTSDE